jgi:hypothetical protein
MPFAVDDLDFQVELFWNFLARQLFLATFSKNWAILSNHLVTLSRSNKQKTLEI